MPCSATRPRRRRRSSARRCSGRRARRVPSRTTDGALVASSYGSVYGWLSDDARQLYVSDGVSLRDYRYALDGTPTGRALPVTPEDRVAGQLAVREAISAISPLLQARHHSLSGRRLFRTHEPAAGVIRCRYAPARRVGSHQDLHRRNRHRQRAGRCLVRPGARGLRGADGPVGLRQVHAAAPVRRHGSSFVGLDRARGPRAGVAGG